jgi:hypothetical protein
MPDRPAELMFFFTGADIHTFHLAKSARQQGVMWRQTAGGP